MSDLHKCAHACGYGAFCDGWSVMVYVTGRRDWERWSGMTEKEAREQYEFAILAGDACELVNPDGEREQEFDPGVVTVKQVTQ